MYVYLLTNLINGKGYVGQTTKSLEERFKGHVAHSKSKTRVHRGKIAGAIAKYGPENFRISLLEECTDLVSLNASETKWIERLNTIGAGYNITIGGDHVPIADETKQKLRHHFLGRKLSQETREKMRASRLGSNGSAARLTWDMVRDIRYLWKQGRTQASLAADFHVKQGTISRIVRNETWVDADYVFNPQWNLSPDKKTYKKISDINELRQAFLAGEPTKTLAERFGITRARVNQIVTDLRQ